MIHKMTKCGIEVNGTKTSQELNQVYVSSPLSNSRCQMLSIRSGKFAEIIECLEMSIVWLFRGIGFY